MDNAEKAFWKEEGSLCDKYVEEKQKNWKRLADSYRLQFKIPGMKKVKTVRLSRMYPLVRQIISSTAIRDPYVFIGAKPLSENYSGDLSDVAMKMERYANEFLGIIHAKEEVNQALFDLLFCGVSWLSYGFNPPGDDIIPPYVANDVFAEGSMYLTRENPFRIVRDPLAGPTRLGYARYIRRRLYVPLEFVLKDPRYNDEAKAKLEARQNDGYDPANLPDFGDPTGESEGGANDELIKGFRANGKIVKMDEWHDRTHYKRITFAEGIDDPMEEVDHPFRRGEAEFEFDMATNERRLTGFTPSNGYIVDQGFQFIEMRFDTDLTDFYPQPPMEYVEDLEKLIIKSVSRRADLLERFKRIIFAENRVKKGNTKFAQDFKEAEDAEVVFLEGINNIKEANWGQVPNDQMGLESDARQYEEQTLHVQNLSAGGSRKSATEVSVRSGQGELNRESMEDVVAGTYGRVVDAGFRLARDPRYTPVAHFVQIGKEDVEATFAILQPEDFDYRWNVDIDVASMRPMNEAIERDNAVMLYDRIINSPNADRLEADKMLVRGFRRRNPERLFKGKGRIEAIRAAQLENVGWLMKGIDPGVEDGQDHFAHEDTHSDENFQEIPEFQELPPEQQEHILAIRDQHVQQHMEMRTQQGTSGGGSLPGGVDSRLMQGQEQSLSEVVRSNAQKASVAARDSVLESQGAG